MPGICMMVCMVRQVNLHQEKLAVLRSVSPGSPISPVSPSHAAHAGSITATAALDFTGPHFCHVCLASISQERVNPSTLFVLH